MSVLAPAGSVNGLIISSYGYPFFVEEDSPVALATALRNIRNSVIRPIKKSITNRLQDLKQKYDNVDLLNNISEMYNLAKPTVCSATTRLTQSCLRVYQAGDAWLSSNIEEVKKSYQKIHYHYYQDINIGLAFSTINKKLQENLEEQSKYDQKRDRIIEKSRYYEDWKKEELKTVTIATINKEIDEFFLKNGSTFASSAKKTALINTIVMTLRDSPALKDHMSTVLPEQLTAEESGLAQSTIVKMTNQYLYEILHITNDDDIGKELNNRISDEIYKKFKLGGPKLEVIRSETNTVLKDISQRPPEVIDATTAAIANIAFPSLAGRRHAGTQTA